MASKKSAAMRALEQELLKKLSAQTGIDYEELAAKAEAEKYPHRTRSMQMEATLDFIKRPQGWTSRKCEECGEAFGTNYSHVAYCGDSCRSKAWVKRMKMPWNLTGKSQEELWGGEVPVIIHPVVWRNLKIMVERMQELVDQNLATVDPEDDYLPGGLDQPENLPDQVDYQEPEDIPPSPHTNHHDEQPPSNVFSLPEEFSFSLNT